VQATRALDAVWSWTAMDLPEAGVAGHDRYLAAARRLGDRLAQLAVEQGDLVTWFHLALRPSGWLLEPMPVDLYDGLAGLPLFLAHLRASPPMRPARPGFTPVRRYSTLSRQWTGPSLS
jgi:hypothetical protein